MTVIERIGTINVVQHGAVFFVIDRQGGDVETFTKSRDAHDRALERCDLVDGFEAICTRH